MPRKTPKRKGTRARVQRKAVKRPKRATVSGKRGTLAAAVKRKASAVREVGPERLKSGPIRVGQTRWLTPTRAGFGALDDALLAIQRAHGTKEAVAYKLDLGMRYKGAGGKRTHTPTGSILLPRLSDLKRRRKKGETLAQTFRRIVEVEIKAAAFRAAEEAPGIASQTGKYERIASLLEAGDFKKARRLMRQVKQARGLQFQVTLSRLIP